MSRFGVVLSPPPQSNPFLRITSACVFVHYINEPSVFSPLTPAWDPIYPLSHMCTCLNILSLACLVF